MNDTLVIDLETKKSFAEVGGERNITQLGISVAGVYSYERDEFTAFGEHELGRLEDMLHETRHIIGFNINHFDIPVLKPYVKDLSVFESIAVTDLYQDAVDFLGHRVGLNAVAEATLGESKSGHGLEALEWFRQGRVEEVKRYCLDDVRLTRDVYEYGKKHGHILFRSFSDNKIHSVPVEWAKGYAKPARVVLEDAMHNRKRLAIEYVSSEDNDGLGFKKTRLIDVYAIKGDEIEAYCHLRKSVRIFRLNRITKIEPTGESYVMAGDVQPALF